MSPVSDSPSRAKYGTEITIVYLIEDWEVRNRSSRDENPLTNI